MSLMKSFIQNFKIFKAKIPPLIYVNSAWNFDYTCIYFLVLLYLFLLSKFWMFIYYNCTFHWRKDSVMKFYFLCWDQWCSNTWPSGQTSFKCINNYNFIFGMYFVLFQLNIMNLRVLVESYCSYREPDPPWRLIWAVIDLTLTSQHRHTATPHYHIPVTAHIFWFSSEPGATTRPSALRNISGRLLACWFFMEQRCCIYLSWIMKSWWTKLRLVYKCDQR